MLARKALRTSTCTSLRNGAAPFRGDRCTAEFRSGLCPLGVKLGHSAMSAQRPVCPKADTAERFMSTRPNKRRREFVIATPLVILSPSCVVDRNPPSDCRFSTDAVAACPWRGAFEGRLAYGTDRHSERPHAEADHTVSFAPEGTLTPIR